MTSTAPLPTRAALALLALLLAVTSTAVTVSAAEEPTGLTVVAETALSDRLHEITVHSPAMERETTLRVLLPTGYDAAADVDHPVLYLLHGCCDTYRSWSDKTDLEAFTADMDVVVVMPDAGNGGWYTDWYRMGEGGTPRWESYHIGELIPWVEATYDVLPRREGRAVAGLSMGGFGAMKYAARHPDLFIAAAAFSGAVDTNVDASGAITDAIAGLDGGRPGDVFGLKATDAVRWQGHNPWDLAENLAPVAVELRTANGMTASGVDPIERYCWEQMTNLHERLDALGQPHEWQDHGPGGHTWDLWERGLHTTLPRFMALFDAPPPAPTAFTYRSIDAAYDVFGWSVAVDRPGLGFSRLAVDGPEGFSLSGSGSATVTTAPLYQPSQAYEVAVDTPAGGLVAVLTAGDDGRLEVAVELGAADVVEPHLGQGLPTSSAPTARVRISPVEGR